MNKRLHETTIEVKYRDTDSVGHVSSPVYYDYIQHAYVKYMHELLDVSYDEKLPQIMVKTQCEYVKPAVLGDTLTVRCGVSRFGNKSFEIEYLIEKSDSERTLIAKAQSTHVAFDYAAHRPIPVPESLKASVAAFEQSV
ncbi:acyl-CoA thioesterase [Paraburkholderia dipogonis]|uniref:Acyl-CoA thioesterase n=1 Tax=Paraburkholderia dipogonis TaxID=1211383 RepID=A0A4Y8MPD2_9BURK|nr:thioesterase family protein [Paraburkholderia dipogonis]TFE39183.1 acyl-CoA thioesterase [Paraburkholderia dipogonis]